MLYWLSPDTFGLYPGQSAHLLYNLHDAQSFTIAAPDTFTAMNKTETVSHWAKVLWRITYQELGKNE